MLAKICVLSCSFMCETVASRGFSSGITALMYAGSLTFMFILLMCSLRQDVNCRGGLSFGYIKNIAQEAVASLCLIASSVMHWRNYVVVSCLLHFHTDFCLQLLCKKKI